MYRKPVLPSLFTAGMVLLFAIAMQGCGRDEGKRGEGREMLTDLVAQVVLALPPGFVAEPAQISGGTRTLNYFSPKRNMGVTILASADPADPSSADKSHDSLVNLLVSNPQHQEASKKDLGGKKVGGIEGRLSRVRFKKEGAANDVFVFSYIHPGSSKFQALLVGTIGPCVEYEDCEEVAMSIVEGIRLP